MGKMNMWTSGFCAMGSLVHFFVLGNIGWGCLLAILAILDLIIGVCE